MSVSKTLAIQRVYSVDGRRIISPTETLTGANLINPITTVAASTTVTIDGSAFSAANLLGFALYSVQKAVTVNFNTTGSPVAYSLSPGIPVDWGSVGHGSSPLATNCTSISIANATTLSSDVYVFVELSS